MAGEAPRHERAPWSARPAPDAALARVHDLAGRPRGTAFAADRHGTLITAHEAVDGLPGLVLRGPGDRRCQVTADAVTALPALGLALVRTEGLGLEPLPLTVRDRVRSGTYVSIAAGGWREARVLGATPVTYPTGDRLHHLGDVLELAVGTAGRDALRPGGGAAGRPGDRSSTPRPARWSASSAPCCGPATVTPASPYRPAPPGARWPHSSRRTPPRCPRTAPT
ncbi:hypothetical protein [Streptomyces sp. H51]|uniref:hypothetical protein n=1 Tax=Streptomyces sp. H51 TaxID=3111770 RepID=UPI003B6381E6